MSSRPVSKSVSGIVGVPYNYIYGLTYNAIASTRGLSLDSNFALVRLYVLREGLARETNLANTPSFI